MEVEVKESSYGNVIQAIPISDIASELFFNRLFAIEPELRDQFEGCFIGRRRAFEWMIGAAVRGMPNLRSFIQALESMVTPPGNTIIHLDCEALGAAFISSLSRTLGPRFTVEMRNGWVAVFELLQAFTDHAPTECVKGEDCYDNGTDRINTNQLH